MPSWEIVKSPIRATFRMVSRLNLLVGHEYRYVFILAHVRSGSTLLSHILSSHPEFIGAGETHISYRIPADLPKLVIKTCEFLHRPILRETFVVDQINHQYVTDEVLLSEQVYKCLILIREPEATLKSMVNLGLWDEKQALELYVNRLEALGRYGLLLKDRAALVEYDELIDHTEHTLAALTSFLSVDSPLTSNYATHRMTARVVGYGDPSDNIKTGQIVRTPDHQITISEDTLIAAACAFHNTRRRLQTVTYEVPHAACSGKNASEK
jgi:hypothetical protein